MSEFGLSGYQSAPQMFNQQQSNFNPFGQTGNPQLDVMLARVALPMLQSFMGGKFIPQQFQSQGLLDQMMAAKWQAASRANTDNAQKIDQEFIYRNLAGMQSRAFGSEPSPLQRAHLKTFAGVINNPVAMGIAEMLLGPQNAEDLFFGRRGSAVRLANAANKVGLYRTDSITGRDRMSEESLKMFSEQVYSNLYGPAADLNDVSGFSAGRVGDLMTDLSARGLLPASMSKLGAKERQRAFQEAGGDKMKFSDSTVADQAIKAAMGRGADIEEITQISGGADAVRKIDATRVSNSIKQYTEALGAVRNIFGDNGMSNAPMQQLIAAMEALTQNSMSSLSPGKIENLMRRTQMAARDSGVSLETLMGLSARGGAIADQYGVARELVGGSVITALEHSKAMDDTGRFTPAFGRMDRNKAALAVQDQVLRADASPTGRYLAVAARLVAENTKNGKLQGKFADSNMAKMVEALQRGETSYYDTTENRTVNIHEEFGRNPDKIMRRYLSETGTSVDQFGALYRDDKNTQEFATSGAARGAQAYELKLKLGNYLAHQTGIIDQIGGDLNADQRAELSGTIGARLSTALIDNVSHAMSAPERIATLKSAFNQSAIDYARQHLGAGASVDEVVAYAEKISKAGAGNIMGFKTDADIEAFLSTRQANAGDFTLRHTGRGIEEIRQTHNARTLAESQNRSRRNINIAGMGDNANRGDGSNFYQRLSDFLAGRGTGSGVEQIFGAVDSRTIRAELLKDVTGGKEDIEAVFQDIKTEYAKGTVDTEQEKKDFADSVNASNFNEIKKYFEGTAGEVEFKDRTRYMKNAEVAAALDAATTKETIGKVKAIYKTHNNTLNEAEVDAIFGDTAKRQAAMAEMAKISGIENDFAAEGINTGIGRDVMTEGRFRRVNNDVAAFGSLDPDKQKRIRAIAQLASEWNSGTTKGKTVLSAYAITQNDAALNKAMTEFMDESGNIDAVSTRLKQLNVDDDQIKKIVATAQFSRNVNDQRGFAANGAGGFNAVEAAGRAGRQTAFEAAVEEGRATGRHAELVKKAKKEKLSPAEQKELDKFFANSSDFAEGLQAEVERAGKGGDSTAARVEKITGEADRLTSQATGPGSASDPTGIGAAIAAAIGPSVTDAFKAAVADIAKSAGFSGELTLKGALNLVGLDKVIADLTGGPKVNETPGGAPVVTPPANSPK